MTASPAPASRKRSCALISQYEVKASMMSCARPSANSRAPVSQMPCAFTQLNTCHQCSAAAVDAQPAARLPDAQRLRLVGDAARPAVARPLPGGHERPGDVLERIAEVRHLPVEDAEDLAAAVEEVAGAVVAVHHRDPRRRRRRMAAQPADAGRGDRLRLELALRVDDAGPVVELAPPAVGRPPARRCSRSPAGRRSASPRCRRASRTCAAPARRDAARSSARAAPVNCDSQPSMRSMTKNGRSSQVGCRSRGTAAAAPAPASRRTSGRSRTRRGDPSPRTRLASGSRRTMKPCSRRLPPLSIQRRSTDQVSRDAPPGMRKQRVTSTSCASCRRAVK